MNVGESIILDVVSDVVCPWCFVGKRRIEKAAAILGQDILVRWHPFELNPQIPREGISRDEYRVRKFGSMERSRLLEQQLVGVGQQVGIDFRYDLMTRTPNTRRAHVLLNLALWQDLETQHRTAERLFSGYFLQGEDPGDPETLLEVAREMNIQAVKGPEVFDDPTLQAAIRNAEQQAYAKGVDSVPSIFCRDQRIGTGAQPEQILADAIRAARVS